MSRRLVARNVANLYAEPSPGSELVTQAILGAAVQGEQEQGEYCFVRTEDRYQGWIGRNRLVEAWDQADFFQTSIATLFAEVYWEPDARSEMMTKLVVSTRICVARRPEVGDWVPLLLPDQRVGYVHKVCLNSTHDGPGGGPDLLDQKARRAIDITALKRQVLAAVGTQAAQVAGRLIGTPYLWGGCTPFGIDCSGFVQLVYKLCGVQLLRDAHLQFADRRFGRVEEGAGLEEANFQAGDLLVFSNRADRQITHIGMALGDGRFIHASGAGGVGIDDCGHAAYNRTYVGAVRLSPDADLAIEAA